MQNIATINICVWKLKLLRLETLAGREEKRERWRKGEKGGGKERKVEERR